MEEKHEESALFHNWLAEIYLDLTTAAMNRNDSSMWFTDEAVHNPDYLPAAQKEVYGRLLQFLDTSTHYEVDRVFARLPSDRKFEGPV